MPRLVHATALALAMLCPIGAGAQQPPPDQTRQWQPAQEGREDALNTAKQRLRLTPEQEQLWGRVDEALRKLRARAQETREQARAGQDMTGDAMDRLRRRADLATQRAETLRTLADAVQPLWGMLSEEQKRDLADLVRLAARGDDPRMTRRDRDERWDRGDHDDRGDQRDRDRWDRGIQREGRGDYGGPPRDRMERRDDGRRHGRDWDDDGRDRRYGGRHDRYDPWIMRRERGWNDFYRDDDRRFERRREWRSYPEDGRGRRDWEDRRSHDRRGYGGYGYERPHDLLEDEQD